MFSFLKKILSVDPHIIKGKAVISQTAIDPRMRIPRDLEDFLKDGKELEYDRYRCEAGRVELTRFENLKLENLRISTKRISRISEQEDPNKNKNGSYIVPAVSLVSKCEHYDSDFVLLWLPQEQLFGSLSGEYVNELLIFPDADWSDIAKDPVTYINAQWKGDYNISKDFNPWQKYPFA